MSEAQFEEKLAIYNARNLQRHEANFTELQETMEETKGKILNTISSISQVQNTLRDAHVALSIELKQIEGIQTNINGALFDISHSRYTPAS